MKKTFHIYLLLVLVSLAVQSCFTGVESTPKITYREHSKNDASSTQREEQLSESITAVRFADWKAGKRFYVTSERIRLVLAPPGGGTPQHTPTEGTVLVFDGVRTTPGIMGEDVTEMLLHIEGETDTLVYRNEASPKILAERKKVEIPFTIDLDLVQKWDQAIGGKDLYVRTPLWHNLRGQQLTGRKFVPVHIIGVQPGYDVYPLSVIFRTEKSDTAAVYMSATDGSRHGSREFPAIFSLTDPHLNYPQITFDVWQHIINNRVVEGMTKTEAKLALGSPTRIDRGHDHTSAYERWTYSDGVVIYFEDGRLIRNH